MMKETPKENSCKGNDKQSDDDAGALRRWQWEWSKFSWKFIPFHRSRFLNQFIEQTIWKSSFKYPLSNILIEGGIQKSPRLYQRKL